LATSSGDELSAAETCCQRRRARATTFEPPERSPFLRRPSAVDLRGDLPGRVALLRHDVSHGGEANLHIGLIFISLGWILSRHVRIFDFLCWIWGIF
jgi:hypothetical protein